MYRSHMDCDQYNYMWKYIYMITFYLLMQINTYTKVCSEHFLPDCLVKTQTGITKLKQGAVPTVFAWSSFRPERSVVTAR